MIDYIKILIKDCDTERLKKLPYLNFRGEYAESTGEVLQTLKAKHHYCIIEIYKSGTVRLIGSIHKLYNDMKGVFAPNYKANNPRYGGYNGNLFTYSEISEVREHLTTLFDRTPEQMVFQNIEFGINTTPNFKPKLFLDGLLYHQNKGFDSKKNGNYKEVEHQQYWLKVYNKSRQYRMPIDTLRVEIKIKKSKYLKKWVGVETFADITPATLERAKNALLDVFNKVVYYDYTIRKEDLKERTKNTLIKYENPNYWLNELQPHHRDRHRKRLAEIIGKYSDNLYKKIVADIEQKCVTINREFDKTKNQKCVTINSLNIGVTVTPKPTELKTKKCLVTGLDISMQKEGSLLLSHTGLKWYFQNDKKEFEKVSKKYLSKKWKNSDFEIKIKELAHNIRNAKNNFRIKHEKLYPKEQYRLFDLTILH